MRISSRVDFRFADSMALTVPPQRSPRRVPKGKGANRKGSKRDCPCGKVRFKDHLQAVAFLHHASNARRDVDELGAELDVATTHRAVRSYRCPTCRGYHVTSQAA